MLEMLLVRNFRRREWETERWCASDTATSEILISSSLTLSEWGSHLMRSKRFSDLLPVCLRGISSSRGLCEEDGEHRQHLWSRTLDLKDERRVREKGKRERKLSNLFVCLWNFELFMRKIEPLTDPLFAPLSSLLFDWSSDSRFLVAGSPLLLAILHFDPLLSSPKPSSASIRDVLLDKQTERKKQTHMCTDTRVKEPVMRLPRICMDADRSPSHRRRKSSKREEEEEKGKSRRSGDSMDQRKRREREIQRTERSFCPQKREELCIRIDLSLFIPSDFPFKYFCLFLHSAYVFGRNSLLHWSLPIHSQFTFAIVNWAQEWHELVIPNRLLPSLQLHHWLLLPFSAFFF